MRDKHVPHEAFVERLESEIGREERRRNAHTTSSGWMQQWSIKSAVALVALVLVSMAAGGAVLAAAYQAQDNERRDALTLSYQRQLTLERDRLKLAQDQLQNAQQRVSMGLGSEDAVSDARVKLIQAESAVKVVQLQLEEIRITKQEPQSQVTSPLVSGRDFVSERWKIEIEVPRTALDAEQKRLATAQRRVDIGVADPSDVSTSRARVIEIEAGIQTFQRKLEIRQQFLKGEFDAGMADLR